MTEVREEAPVATGLAPARVDDADDLRSFHLNRLLRKRSTQVTIAILAIAAHLDTMRTAAASVAQRIREEAAE